MYTIVRELYFDTKCESISGNFQRMQDIDTAIDWALSRNPTEFENIKDNYYLLVTDELVNNQIPQLRILYKVEGVFVILIDIEVV